MPRLTPQRAMGWVGNSHAAPTRLPPAVILSGHLGTPLARKASGEIPLALSRSLGRRGVRVYRFHPERSQIDLESRYCEHVPCPNHYYEETRLIEFLLEFARERGEHPVLFPASDGAVEFLALHEPELRGSYTVGCASWDSVRRIQDKQQLLEHAAAMNIPIPATAFPKSLEELACFARTIQYPAVVKPLTSYHWRRPAVAAVVGGDKAVVVHGAEELLDTYRKIAPLAPDLMVQEIVPGEIDRLITFLGYVDRQGRPLAGCVRKKLRQYPHGFGYCCLTETVRDPEIMDLSLRLLASLGYRGIVAVEFKRDPRDGTPRLIEINARAVRTTGVAVAAGVDLPWIAYQDLTSDTPVAPVFDYRVPVRWVHLRSEFHAAMALIKRGELGFWQWVRIFRDPFVEAVWAWDDPKPGILNATLPAIDRVFSAVSPRRRRLAEGRTTAHARR